MTEEKKKKPRHTQTFILINMTLEVIESSTKIVRILTGMSVKKYKYAQLDVMALYAASLKARAEQITAFVVEEREK